MYIICSCVTQPTQLQFSSFYAALFISQSVICFAPETASLMLCSHTKFTFDFDVYRCDIFFFLLSWESKKEIANNLWWIGYIRRWKRNHFSNSDEKKKIIELFINKLLQNKFSTLAFKIIPLFKDSSLVVEEKILTKIFKFWMMRI